MRAVTIQGIRDGLRKRAEIWRTYGQKLQRVVERDTAHQLASAERGGAMTSNLTPEGEAAANRIIGERAREVASLGGSLRPGIVRDHDDLLTTAATVAKAAASEIRALLSYEAAMVEFFRETEQPQRHTAGSQDLALHLEGFAQRIAQIQAPPKAVARSVQQAPVRPDFSDLLLQ